MPETDSDDNELVVPPAFRDQVERLFGERRAEIVINLVHWVVTHNPQDLRPLGVDSTLWEWIFWVPAGSGDPVEWVFELEMNDERLMRFVPTRVFRKNQRPE